MINTGELEALAEELAKVKEDRDAHWRKLVAAGHFVASDKMASSYQTLEQYRCAVINLLLVDEESKCSCDQLRTALAEAVRLIKNAEIITADELEQLEIALNGGEQ